MPSLRELQSQFRDAVLGGDASALLPHLADGRGIPAAQRLQVYENNTFITLSDALAATFPVVQRLVGEAFFRTAAAAHVRQQPPISGSLITWGDRFAAFLASYEPARGLPYLPDVADLEWARNEAYHAAEASPFPVASLLGLPAEAQAQVTLPLHPSARLLHAPYPIARIWEANCQPEVTETIDLDQGPDWLLVIRPQAEVEVRILDASSHALLSAFAAGATVDEAGQRALALDPNYDLATALAQFMQSGVFCAFQEIYP